MILSMLKNFSSARSNMQLDKVHETAYLTKRRFLIGARPLSKFMLTREIIDSVLAYKQLHKVGRFAPKDAPAAAVPIEHLNIPIGARCQVESTEEGFHKRGTVRFVGSTKFGNAAGVWVGVEYDEPIGKNDGSVNGERYFECRMKYGGFVRPEKVQVGDFPVEDLNLDDEEI
jgi:tubulin-specific chaperone B